MGRTMAKLGRECSCEVESLSSTVIKKVMKYYPVPTEELWRVELLNELISNELEVPGFDINEVEEMIYHLCTM